MKKLGNKNTYKPNTAMSEDAFRAKFSTETKARKHWEKTRWGNKPKCPVCGSINIGTWNRSDGKKGWYRCNNYKCREQFTVRKGSVLEGSKIPIRKWLLAEYYIVTARKGISGLELAKKLGITQKSAWFLHQRIRHALDAGNYDFLLGGFGKIVQSDETYCGGRNKNRHKDKKVEGSGPVGKSIVLGMAEKGGRRKAVVISNVERETIQAEIDKHVRKRTLLATDEGKHYVGVQKQGYRHRIFRLNEGSCKYLTMERVDAIASYCIGKRLTWAECVREQAPPCSLRGDGSRT